MTISSTAGAIISVSNAAVTSATDTSGEYAALTYIAIGEVESIGDFGDTANLINFTSLTAARVRKLKGSRDAGELALVCGNDPLDAGQIALIGYEKTKFLYAIKIELADKPAPAGTNSIFYFQVLVNSAALSVGEADNVVKRNFALPIDTAIIEVPATTGA